MNIKATRLSPDKPAALVSQTLLGLDVALAKDLHQLCRCLNLSFPKFKRSCRHAVQSSRLETSVKACYQTAGAHRTFCAHFTIPWQPRGQGVDHEVRCPQLPSRRRRPSRSPLTLKTSCLPPHPHPPDSRAHAHARAQTFCRPVACNPPSTGARRETHAYN